MLNDDPFMTLCPRHFIRCAGPIRQGAFKSSAFFLGHCEKPFATSVMVRYMNEPASTAIHTANATAYSLHMKPLNNCPMMRSHSIRHHYDASYVVSIPFVVKFVNSPIAVFDGAFGASAIVFGSVIVFVDVLKARPIVAVNFEVAIYDRERFAPVGPVVAIRVNVFEDGRHGATACWTIRHDASSDHVAIADMMPGAFQPSHGLITVRCVDGEYAFFTLRPNGAIVSVFAGAIGEGVAIAEVRLGGHCRVPCC